MTRMTWGALGTRSHQSGVDRGVFYPQVGPGLPWNGLISVAEQADNVEPRFKYVDGIRFSEPKTGEGFAAVLQAYTCPREFEDYDGTSGILSQQRRRSFGLSYRTRLHDDISGEVGHLIHVVYNAIAAPAPLDAKTARGDGSSLGTFSWNLTTTPVDIPGAQPAAHLIIDTSVAYPEATDALENALYGSDSSDPYLPTPQVLMDLIEPFSVLLIVNHGDGTWTAMGPDDVVYMLNSETFAIDWPSVRYLSDVEYEVRSL